MDRIIAPGTVAVGSGDTAPVTGTPGQATNGVPGSIPATLFPAYGLNMLVEELRNIVVAGGLTPSGAGSVPSSPLAGFVSGNTILVDGAAAGGYSGLSSGNFANGSWVQFTAVVFVA